MYTSCSYCVPDRPVDWSVSQSPPNHMIARNWHSVADTFSDCTADGPADNGICKKKNFLHSPSSAAAVAVSAPKDPFLLLSPGAARPLTVCPPVPLPSLQIYAGRPPPTDMRGFFPILYSRPLPRRILT